MTSPLVIGKPIREETAKSFNERIRALFVSPRVTGAGVPGLSLSRTKAGKLSLRRAKTRLTDAVTLSEVLALSEYYGEPASEIEEVITARGLKIINRGAEVPDAK